MVILTEIKILLEFWLLIVIVIEGYEVTDYLLPFHPWYEVWRSEETCPGWEEEDTAWPPVSASAPAPAPSNPTPATSSEN